MRKKPTRKRPYFMMESAMTAILPDASGKMHHGILFDPPLHYYSLIPLSSFVYLCSFALILIHCFTGQVKSL